MQKGETMENPYARFKELIRSLTSIEETMSNQDILQNAINVFLGKPQWVSMIDSFICLEFIVEEESFRIKGLAFATNKKEKPKVEEKKKRKNLKATRITHIHWSKRSKSRR